MNLINPKWDCSGITNPVNEKWSRKMPHSFLSLPVMAPTYLKHARNTITQNRAGKHRVIIALLYSDKMTAGQKAGSCLFGQNTHETGAMKMKDVTNMRTDNNGKFFSGIALEQNKICLRKIIGDLSTNKTELQYSFAGTVCIRTGDPSELSENNYGKGMRPGLFWYTIQQSSGSALFQQFHYGNAPPLKTPFGKYSYRYSSKQLIK